MITTQAKTLVELLEEQERFRREKEHLVAFQTREQELMRYELRLQNLITQFRVLRDRQVLQMTALSESPLLFQMLSEFKQMFAENPEAFTQQNALDKLKRNLDNYFKKLQERLQNAWKRFSEQQLPTLPKDVLLVLERIPAFSLRVVAIRQRFEMMLERLKSLPNRVEDIDEFLKCRQDIERLWSELDSGELPEEVLRFLQHSSSPQGASLSSLTPVVLDWLSQQELLQSFRIRTQ